MENGTRTHASGTIPKETGKSKFYTGDMSFEDNFNPTSIRNQDSTGKISEIKDPKEFSISVDDVVSVDGPQSHRKHPSYQGSPLMCYVVRLKRGEELRRSLISFAKENGLKAAFVMTCVGSALSAKIRVASATANDEPNFMLDVINPTEIVSLEGTLSGGGHLHVSLSDFKGNVVGGHLLELTVDTTAEVVIGDCSALSFSRVFDDTTGFNELTVNTR